MAFVIYLVLPQYYCVNRMEYILLKLNLFKLKENVYDLVVNNILGTYIT